MTPRRLLLPDPASSVPWTGERFVPSQVGEIAVEHLHRYVFAADLCRGKEVLDIACGEGYGAYLVAQSAGRVVGIDADEATVAAAARRYRLPNLVFCPGSCVGIPLANASVDCVVSFETLEHIHEHEAFLAEIKRVLRTEGQLILSTPDRDLYNAGRSEPNRYHVRELSRAELDALLGRHFTHFASGRQKALLGSVIVGDPGPTSGGRTDLSIAVQDDRQVIVGDQFANAPYLIALCSDDPLPRLASSLFEGAVPPGPPPEGPDLSEDLRERDAAVSRLKEELLATRDRSERRQRELAAAKVRLAEARGDLMAAQERQGALERAVGDREARLANETARREEAEAAARAGQDDPPEREGPGEAGPDGRLRTLGRAVRGWVSRPGAGGRRRRREARVIRASPLFDPAFYLSSNEDVRSAGHDPLDHYLSRGAKEGRDPHRLFDVSWYLETNPDVREAGLDPLAHYLASGWREGRDPHPLFDTSYYLQAHPDVARRGREPLAHYLAEGGARALRPHPLFDAPFYVGGRAGPLEDGLTPLEHYLRSGAAEGRQPHRLFDGAFYLGDNPDVRASGVNPLVHYLTAGWRERRAPHPLFHPAHYLAGNPEIGASEEPLRHYLARGGRAGLPPHVLFDPACYLRQAGPLAEGETPLEHYVRIGAERGLQPHPLFDAGFYLEKNEDVRDAGSEPLGHYLTWGAKEGRQPHPVFDISHYLETNPDVRESGLEPLTHYLTIGWRRGADPHPLFDVSFYLEDNPEVARSGEEPLQHYLAEGGRRGRRPHPLFEPAFYQDAGDGFLAEGLTPLEHYVRCGADEGRRPHPLFDGTFYLDENEEVRRGGLDPLGHYVSRGARAGLAPHPLFDPVFYLREQGLTDQEGVDPLEHYWRQGRFEGAPPNAWGVGLLASEVWAALEASRLVGALTEEVSRLRFESVERPRVSVIIPVFNQIRATVRCLKALSALAPRESEIILIDDASTDETATVLPAIPGVRYRRNPDNLGFLRSCNAAAAEARGDYLVFLNNDTVPLAGWLEALESTFHDLPDAGLAGSMLLGPDGRLQEAGALVWADGSALNVGRGDGPDRPAYRCVREADYCSGASIMVKASAWRQLGGFDEAFAPAYYEDVDLAFRLRDAGYRVYYQPFSRVVHFEGLSSGRDLGQGVKRHQTLNQPKFTRRWASVLEKHPDVPGAERTIGDRLAEPRALVVDAVTPRIDEDAGSMETWQYLRALRDLGYRTTFAPGTNRLYDGDHTAKLQRQGIECLYGPHLPSAEDYLLREGPSFDLVLLFRAPVAAAWLDAVKEHAPDARVVFQTVDLHFLREEREARLRRTRRAADRARRARRTELSVMRRADCTILLSDYERDLLGAEAPEIHTRLVRMGRDVPGPRSPFGIRRDVVFLGGFAHPPNVDAVVHFVQDTWPLVRGKLPGCRFVIAGSNVVPQIEQLASEDIVVRGFVPDLAELFARFRLSVAPLRYGAGVKGKIVSSLCHGVPVAASPVAFEGMGLERDEGVVVAEGPEDLAAVIAHLYTDESRWRQVSDAGVSAMRRLYSVEAFRRQLAEVLAACGLEAPAQ